MAISKWDRHHVADCVLQILGDAYIDEDRESGRAFMTQYQLAIEFRRRFPDIAEDVARSTGGRGEGPGALTRYLTKELVDRIKANEIPQIEFTFLDGKDIKILEFSERMRATTIGVGNGTTMFRLANT